MQSGRLRHVLRIQRKTTDQDTTGQEKRDWSDVYTSVRAAIEPAKGREIFAAQQMNAAVDTTITIRFRDGVTAKMRAIDELGTIYDIKAVFMPKLLKQEMQLLCVSGLNDG